MKFRRRLKQTQPRRGRKRVSGNVTKLTWSKQAFTTKSDAASAITEEGVLRMEGEVRQVPAAWAEAGDNNEAGLRPGTMVLVIVALALVFIIIITWFIAQMPEK